MGIQQWSEDTILVELAPEPEMVEDLETIMGIVSERDECNVVIDFGCIETITSSNLSRLLQLRKLLGDCRNRLIFCSVTPTIKGVFAVTGLDKVFELADDKFFALATLDMVG